MSDTSSRESFDADHEEKNENRELPEVDSEGTSKNRELPEGDHDEKNENRELPEGVHNERSDEELINELGRKAATGDSDAQKQLFTLVPFYTRMKWICRAIARRYKADSRELLQEFYKKIPSIIKGYEAKGELLAWISPIVRNLQIDLLRRQNAQKKYDTAYWQRTEGGRENTVEERIVNRIDVKKALSSLSAVDRQIVELRNMGYTFKDIAGVVDMSPSQCYRHWKRVLRDLQLML